MRIRHLLLIAAVIAAPFTAVASSPATAASGQRLGVYNGPGDVAGMDAFGAWLGRTPTYASDYVDYRSGWNAIANPIWTLDTWSPWVRADPSRGLVFAVAMLPESARGQLASGAAGAFDGYFSTLAHNMVDRGLGSSVIRLGWEANGNWFPWAAAGDPTSWKTYYRRIVRTMRDVAGAAFTFDWNPASSAAGTNLPLAAYYPGDDVVDIIGLDAYDLVWADTTSTPAARWDFTLNQFNGLNTHRAFATQHGKPLSFPEWGLYAKGDVHGGGGDNPYYVDHMADWFQSTNTAYQTYFNSDWGGGTLASFPQGRDRYRARFGPATVPPPTTTTTTVAPTTAPTTTSVPAPSGPPWWCTNLPEPYRSICSAAYGGSP